MHLCILIHVQGDGGQSGQRERKAAIIQTTLGDDGQVRVHTAENSQPAWVHQIEPRVVEIAVGDASGGTPWSDVDTGTKACDLVQPVPHMHVVNDCTRTVDLDADAREREDNRVCHHVVVPVDLR